MPSNVIGSQEFRSNIKLENYYPKETKSSGTPFDDLVKSPDIDTLRNGESSQLEKDIKKTVRGIQEMVLAYVKGRVPLGDDKFNTTDMLRSMLDMLNATGNMQRVALQEDGNKIGLHNLFVSMSRNVGREALVKDHRIEFKGKTTDLAIDIPEQEGIVQVALIDEKGLITREWTSNSEPGIQYINWDGLDKDGEVAKQGQYIVHATITDEEGKSAIIPSYIPKRIQEVRPDPANGKPVYYSGNQPIRQMLSIYSGDPSVLAKSVDEVA